MNLLECYRLLELQPPADLSEIKSSYRRLARCYHPDINPEDPRAQDRFIQVTEAYNVLVRLLELDLPEQAAAPNPVQARPQTPAPEPEPVPEPVAPLSDFDLKLKQSCYTQLQDFLRSKRFPRATALVEGLAARLPQDLEVRQWQAITYQSWGRHLISERQYDKARQFLRKALSTDPHNRSLWSEVERDFRRLDNIK
jgi:curved DNA-binding protein CbpA